MWYWLKKLFRKKKRVLCQCDITITYANGHEWQTKDALVECIVLAESGRMAKVNVIDYNKTVWVSKNCIIEYLN